MFLEASLVGQGLRINAQGLKVVKNRSSLSIHHYDVFLAYTSGDVFLEISCKRQQLLSSLDFLISPVLSYRDRIGVQVQVINPRSWQLEAATMSENFRDHSKTTENLGRREWSRNAFKNSLRSQ